MSKGREEKRKDETKAKAKSEGEVLKKKQGIYHHRGCAVQKVGSGFTVYRTGAAPWPLV